MIIIILAYHYLLSCVSCIKMLCLVKLELILTTPTIGCFICIYIIHDSIIIKAKSKVLIYKITSNYSCHLTPTKTKSLPLWSLVELSV